MMLLKNTIKKLRYAIVNTLPAHLANKLPFGGLTKKSRWSIGIYVGDSPYELTAAENIKNPVLSRRDISDVPTEFVADPFMIKAEQSWYMFFELLNQRTGRGEIAFATSEDALLWKYQQIVLAEPFHLSYPYVFEWMNEYYMIPETYQADAIRLYKASHFPTQWNFIGNIISGGLFIDSSIFRYQDKWWLFTETTPNNKSETLRLFFADELLGTWKEHPKSPIIAGNPEIARPGGRVLVMDDKIIRFTQGCIPDYGTNVRAFEITELTTTTYEEREVENNLILQPTGSGWNGAGMHNIDVHLMQNGKWIACVDGRG
jgi:hypothetical protein